MLVGNVMSNLIINFFCRLNQYCSNQSTLGFSYTTYHELLKTGSIPLVFLLLSLGGGSNDYVLSKSPRQNAVMEQSSV